MTQAVSDQEKATGNRRAAHGEADARATWFQRRPLAMLVGLFVFAFVVRLAVIPVLPQEPTYGDEADYMELAEKLATDGTYPARPFRPPGYPAFLAGLHLLGLDSYDSVRVFQALVGALAVVVAALVATRILTETAGVAAGVVMATYPLWVYAGATAYPQTLVACLLYLMILLLLVAKRRVSTSLGLALGIAGGVTALMVPVYAAVVPVGLAWLYVVAARQGASGFWRFVAVCVLGIIVVVGPWTARNYLASGEFIPVSTNGAVNFWLGNNKWATVNTKSHLHPFEIYGDELSELSPRQQERFMIEAGLEHIASDPIGAMRFGLAKFLAFFRPWPGQMVESGSQSMVRKTGLWVVAISSALVIGLGMLGAILTWRRHSETWLLVGMVILIAGLYSVFFTAVRFRMPLDGIFAMLAVAGLAELRRQARRANGRCGDETHDRRPLSDPL
ncbi:MAG: glycosyltransferase family 39 protein [Armatimonadota bacterium]|nr:glycosyltransferase family 39 protein [Armatimonadota bacterium]